MCIGLFRGIDCIRLRVGTGYLRMLLRKFAVQLADLQMLEIRKGIFRFLAHR